jgi:hypothetical protein
LPSFSAHVGELKKKKKKKKTELELDEFCEKEIYDTKKGKGNTHSQRFILTKFSAFPDMSDHELSGDPGNSDLQRKADCLSGLYLAEFGEFLRFPKRKLIAIKFSTQ